MLVFRSLALGLIGACFLLLAFRPAYVVRVERPPAQAAATLVDVGRGVAPGDLAQLVHLGAGEHVIEVDDRAVDGDLDAGAAIAAHDLRPGSFIDLTVERDGARRRVLVLLH